jgi:hypothetical protein
LIGFCCCIVLVPIGAIPPEPASFFVELAFGGVDRRVPASLFIHVAAISTLAPTSETLDQISRPLILDVLMELAPPAIQRLSPRGNH